MSFTPKNLTRGGQMTAYRLRMFTQVNGWISGWILLFCLLVTGAAFWLVTPEDALRNGFFNIVKAALTAAFNKTNVMRLWTTINRLS